jgi:hypothetical protein
LTATALVSLPELPIVRTMQDAIEVFRILKNHWELTNSFCDEVGGLTSGHTDKCLGPTEEKRLGYDTFALFTELFAVEFVPRLNPEAVARMNDVWEKRRRLLEHSGNPKISKKLVERAKPHVFREMQRLSTTAKMTCFTAEHRSRIARKAAKSRWRKQRRIDAAATA